MRGGECRALDTELVDRVELLLVIDNSSEMADVQTAVAAQYEALLTTVTSNDSGPVARSIHSAVISTDLGAAQTQAVGACRDAGDDAVFQSTPRLDDCAQAYPPFLQWDNWLADYEVPRLAQDLGCLAALGDEGCGYVQPLESMLKALWPAEQQPALSFLGDGSDAQSQLGQGDRANQNFRGDVPAVLAIVLASRHDDCSAADADLIADSSSPSARCVQNAQLLTPLSRYASKLKTLYPRVVFGALVGVPEGSVDDEVDLADASERERYYDELLSQPEMQARVADDRVQPACEGPHGAADPARRIVETARDFAEDGIVQSVCADDYQPAMARIAERIRANLGEDCLHDALERNDEGLVACDIIWELPPSGTGGPYTPTACDDRGARDFLMPVRRGAAARTADGGARCRVAQLAVEAESTVPTKNDSYTYREGWYYDDFSSAQNNCRGGQQPRITFTTAATPTPDVRVVLDCDRGAGL
jgi:hypothetical protein